METIGGDIPYGLDTLHGLRFRPHAWDKWLAGAPESENIEDRRNDPEYELTDADREFARKFNDWRHGK